MLKRSELKFAIEDARVRQEAVNHLLHEIDKKALGLLGISITLIVAMLSLVAADLQRHFLPAEFSIGLIAASITMLASAFFSLRTMKAASIKLPGRDADFWAHYVDSQNPGFRDACIEYLKALQTGNEENRELNRIMVSEYRKAKFAFTFAPLVGFLFAVTSAAVICWITRT